MKTLFELTSSNWVRYSEYEWRAAEDGTLYLMSTKMAQPSIYEPWAEYQKIVLDAINIGRMCMSKKPDVEIQKAIQQWMFSFMLTDSETPIKLCRHCTKAFGASRPRVVFCSPQCKNKYNVYKSRARKNSSDKE